MPAEPNWTVDMLDALPDDGQRYEIIDGELFVTPAPTDVHQLVAAAFHARIAPYLRASSVARALIFPADVRRGDRARNPFSAARYARNPFSAARYARRSARGRKELVRPRYAPRFARGCPRRAHQDSSPRVQAEYLPAA